MTDPDKTLPPRRPNTLRSLFLRMWEWVQANPKVALGFVLGVVAGAVVF